MDWSNEEESREAAGYWYGIFLVFILQFSCVFWLLTSTWVAPRSAVSAVAARRVRQQQQQEQEQNASTSSGIDKEPPVKKTRSSNAQEVTQANSSRQSQTETTTTTPKAGIQEQITNTSNVDTISEALDEDEVIEEDVGIINEQENGIDAGQDGEEYANETACWTPASLTLCRFETPSQLPVDIENFTLSRHRLSKKDVVYSDEDMLCVRIKEKTVWTPRMLHVLDW